MGDLMWVVVNRAVLCLLSGRPTGVSTDSRQRPVTGQKLGGVSCSRTATSTSPCYSYADLRTQSMGVDSRSDGIVAAAAIGVHIDHTLRCCSQIYTLWMREDCRIYCHV